ncbi:ABC transporter [Microbacterium sp. 1.5R]|uniref:ABC transporter n=1 Tax=Microbacterium sp. 1.5R TaxID=1916917 RepID=UPI0011A8C8CE|nr:ABC transporter [Microbacterium sp. 1.5R]
MSDPEVPQPERRKDVDDVVDSANAGLDAAEAARADVPGRSTTDAAADDVPAPRTDPAVDPDLAAFEAAERDHPGTFATPELNDLARSEERDSARSDGDSSYSERDSARSDGDPSYAARDADATAVHTTPVAREDSTMASAAYSAPDDTETRVVPSEPVVRETTAAEPAGQPTFTQQPIFVQAPEAPRERGNRGTAGAIGLLATLAFAILYLGTTLGLGAWAGDVTAENIAESALAPLTTWGFWVPVVVFFLGFWLLGAFINRGRWGLWVVFGIIVGLFAYGGHLLGQLFEERFWLLTASEGSALIGEQLFAPLAIAAFVFGRELTIWFGAWVARSGARKTELNAEAQREYERTLEAGPTLSR